MEHWYALNPIRGSPLSPRRDGRHQSMISQNRTILFRMCLFSDAQRTVPMIVCRGSVALSFIHGHISEDAYERILNIPDFVLRVIVQNHYV